MLKDALTGWQRPEKPLHDALATALREAVLDGRVRVGDRLPSERRLAAELGVSRGTVVAALSLMRAEGWLVTEHGRGSEVRLPPSFGERYAPLSVDGQGSSLDLRRAVPAAPRTIVTEAAARALARSARLLLESGEPGAGLPELRELIAQRYTAEGLATRPEQILVTSGARAALAMLVAHFDPRRTVVENPAFFGTLATLRRFGGRTAPLRVTTEGWDTDQLTVAFREASGGVACLVPDFQNPTGALMSSPVRREISELAARHRVTVIVDETMRDIDLRDHPVPEPRIRQAVTIGSMSKTVWGGLRVGWIRGSAALIRELLLDPVSGLYTPPPMEQLVVCEVLPFLDALLAHRRGELRRQRDHLAGRLNEDDAWTFSLPQGGLALWLRLSGVSGETLARKAARAGLSLLPGSKFSPDGTLANWLRVPYTAPAETLDRVVEHLGQAYRSCWKAHT
ncbi:PLP-dependent aminotransferase family protein [Streptosporangium sp. NPDC000396]|uniref:aminotransferase-like domain-containing protein n=1 Tax=Streptosporangium sp. NPDC000396 TaxID=3366185 RepID=UPI0036CD8B27